MAIGGASVVSESALIVAPGPCFVIQYLVSFQALNHPAEENRSGCFTFLFPLSCC